jgi:ElaB/YqjD/DUF883 family membrane-anchored ribosome-binding protein
MAHDNYNRFYTWDKGTLILDPGIFAWDEPHLEICDQPVAHANRFDHLARPDLTQLCRYPDRLLAMKHIPAPISVRQKCDTLEPGEAYCCPPYAMPDDWRVDFMPMGQEEDPMANGNGNGNGLLAQEAQMFYVEARQIGSDVQSGVQPVAMELSDEAQALYVALRKELGVVGSDIAITMTPVIRDVEAEVGPVLREIEAGAAPVVEPAVQETRETVRKWPLLSLGLGVAGGFVIGKMLAKRGR